MAEVKWIKITTDIFDNRKIKHLRRLPDGNNIVLIWVMLLTMAGRCNASGKIFLTEKIPYTPKMLADELDFAENTVKLALDALQQLNMINIVNDYYSIVDELERMDKNDKKYIDTTHVDSFKAGFDEYFKNLSDDINTLDEINKLPTTTVNKVGLAIAVGILGSTSLFAIVSLFFKKRWLF